MTQSLIVALLVVACSLRAAWILAPGAARRAVARALLTWRLPSAFAAPLRRHAQDAGEGCGCDGCDKGAGPGGPKASKPKPGATVAPITFHRRPPR